MSYDREFTSPISETAHDLLESTSSSPSVPYDVFFPNESINYVSLQLRDFVPAYQRRRDNYAGARPRIIRTTEFGIPEGSSYRCESRPNFQSTQEFQSSSRQTNLQKSTKPESVTSKHNKPGPSGESSVKRSEEGKSRIPASTGAISKTSIQSTPKNKSAPKVSKSTETHVKGKKKQEQPVANLGDPKFDTSAGKVLTFQADIEAADFSEDSDHSGNSSDSERPYVYHLIAYEDTRHRRCCRLHKVYNKKTGKSEMVDDLDEQEKKVVVEFCHLLEKSKQLFNGLRDLPQYGHRQWQGYFGRTFDIYTKIWKFQQQHRGILDHKYGLKRWQIGEIASKIGQLYYHYYLRTSETNYLNEAYSFYSAIRGRSYYSKAAKEDRSDLMVKKLRYYARFIVVCLLLKKLKLVRDLIIELEKQVSDYSKAYDPDDHLEWNVVLDEIKSFIKAEAIVAVIHADSNTIVLCHRLTPLTTPPVERSAVMNLTLQEILIVGSCSDQVKFSELTMDMFRMLQTLEREPQEDFNHIYDASPVGHPGRNFAGMPSTKGGYGDTNGERAPKLENPHKYLLYKPSLSQLLVFLSSGFKELPANGALLLYISADGCFSNNKHPEDMAYDLGGVRTNSRHEPDYGRRGLHLKETHCLHPGDLYPFTRKPLFLIIDSDNSHVFQHLPRYFGQPVVSLMSPQELPTQLQEQQTNGSLFTMFLNSPLTALCYSCNLNKVPIHHWERCQSYIDRFVTEASRLFTRARVDMAYMQFFGDDFLRLILVRYVFCEVVLRLHRGFRARHMRPRCSPPLPEAELLNHPTLQGLVMDLAAHLDLMSFFHDMPD